ncbi:MAG: PA14 domain-containing protein, partial [Planctomycetota bacterium]|nr:PA14 domain-containing protein [Planctomycetota bacterium]
MRLLAVFALLGAVAAAQERVQPHEPGIDVRVFQIGASLSVIPTLIDGQTPNVHFLAKTFDFDESRDDFRAPFKDTYLVHVSARLRVPAAGKYTFRLTSDDGSALFLDGKNVLDHDGLHGATSVELTLDLEARAYELFCPYFENGGDAVLKLEWRRTGQGVFRVLSAAECTTPKGIVRVTAPGLKKVKRKSNLTAPGDGRPLTDVHPSYDLATIRPENFSPRVGGIDFLADGTMLVCCWEPEGGVYRVTGVHGGNDDEALAVQRIAAGLAEPLGIKVVGERIFVLQKQELTELIDANGDGVTDEYRCIADGWNVSANFHEFAFGLVERDGWLYFNLATAINPGGASTRPQVPDRGRSVRVRIQDGRTEFMCHGLRTPNGIGIGVDGEIFITDNQGDWLPVSKLLHLTPGAFFNGMAALPEGWKPPPVKPPVVWLPQNEIGNSPSEPGLFHK